MGETRITAVVRNPVEPDRLWEGVFIVDTGAMDSSVPRRQLEAIGLPAAGLRVYVMGDGREVRMPVTAGIIEFMGEIAGVTIIMGSDESEPLLGLTALESTSFAVDPQSQTLVRLPPTRF